MAVSERAIRAGRAAIELFLDDEGLKRQINQVRRQLQSMGQTLLSVGSQLTVVGAAIAGPFTLAISAASDLTETMSKFEVVFGTQSNAMKKWADDFATAVGRSKQEIAGFLAGTQDLLVPIGIDPATAAQLSKQVAQLAVDLGSFNNVADGDALRDLQAALTGESEPMKKYGVIVNEAAVKQQLLNKGLDALSATDADKAIARLEIIMRGTAAAQGDAIRTADSFANQLKALKAVSYDTAAAIGGAIIPAATKVIGVLRDVIAPIAQWAAENQGLVVSVAAVGVSLVGLGVSVTTLGVAVSSLATLFAALGSVVGAVGAPALALIGLMGGLLVVTADWDRVLRTLGDTGRQTFQTIENALRSGDLESAAKAAAIGIQIAFLESFEAITSSLSDMMSNVVGASGVLGKIAGKAAKYVFDTGVSEYTAKLKSDLTNLRQFAVVEAAKADEARARNSDEFAAPQSTGASAFDPNAAKAREAAEAQAEAAKRLTEETRTAAEKRASELERINQLLAAGAITEETYRRAVARVNDEFSRSDKATAERIKREEQLAEARRRAQDDLARDAASVRESVKSPDQKFKEEADRLREMRDKGLINPAEFDQAFKNARAELAAGADEIRDSLKTPEDRFRDRSREIQEFGARGFLTPAEVQAAIKKARDEMANAADTLTPRRSEPVFADQVRFGLGGQEIDRQQLSELMRIRRGIDEQNRKKAARIGA